MSRKVDGRSNNIPDGFSVPGCPVADGGRECMRGCGGFYPISTQKLTELVVAGRFQPQNLCGQLLDQIHRGQAALSVQSE